MVKWGDAGKTIEELQEVTASLATAKGISINSVVRTFLPLLDGNIV